MRFKLSCIVNIIIIINIASCTTAQFAADATTPLNDRAYTDLGMAAGTDSAWSLFGLWMFGRPDMDEAVKDALAEKGGDALINVTAEQKKLWFFFFSVDTVYIDGKAIKFYIEEGAPENEIDNEQK